MPKHAAPPGRARRVAGGTVVGVLALVAMVVIGAGIVLDPQRPLADEPVVSTTATSTAAGPSSGSTPVSPTAAPGSPAGIPTGFPTPVSLPTPTDLPSLRQTTAPPGGRPSGDLEGPLVANRLYRQRLSPVSCAQQPRPIPQTETAYRAFLTRMFGCLDRLYEQALDQAGDSLSRPYVVFFDDRIQTPCGVSPTELSVFYCSANETVYATRRGLDDYGSMRLGLFYVVFHEYAHHVQERAGILDAARFRHEDWPQVSRRLELQAECMMGMSLRLVRSTKLTDADIAELHGWRSRVPDDQHGSGDSQIFWIDRGLSTRSLGDCNTWDAPLAQVR